MRSAAARRPSSAPRWEGPRNGPRNRPQSPQPETVSHSETGFRDTLSARPAIRKVHPVLSVQTGTRFPLAWPLGKRGPDRGGCDPAMRGLAAPTAPLR